MESERMSARANKRLHVLSSTRATSRTAACPCGRPFFILVSLRGFPTRACRYTQCNVFPLYYFALSCVYSSILIPPPCLQDYDLRSRLTLLPVWMTKLNALYKRREALPADHAIALPAA